jgi:hypothetical protein
MAVGFNLVNPVNPVYFLGSGFSMAWNFRNILPQRPQRAQRNSHFDRIYRIYRIGERGPEYPISNDQYPISKWTAGTAVFDRMTGLTGWTGFRSDSGNSGDS